MKEFLYNMISKSVKTLSKSDIIGKQLYGSNKKLYYERSQHLTFLLQKQIKYEEVIQNKIKKLIKQGDTVFDIGANIGQFALPFSEMVGESGRVISFEPDFKNFSFLQFNINMNRCRNVKCENYGIGGDDTELEFYRDTETGGRRGSYRKEYVGPNFKGFSDKVQLKKFDSIISEFGEPNFVKIDVEGFETEVIRGLTTDLKNCIFLIEVRGETKGEVFNFFSVKEYQCIWIDYTDKIIQKINEIPDFANLIFKKNASSQHFRN